MSAGDTLRDILFLPEQASTFAERVDGLHYWLVISTMVVSTLIGLTALGFFVRYRRRHPDQQTPNVHGPLWLETSFVVVPGILFLAWFAVGFKDFVWLSTPPPEAIDIYVMGKKWMWKYSYPDGPNSVDVLHVPRGRPVRLLLTSRDVIHSWFVPDFRIKQDVLPGRYSQTWFTATKAGRYQVLCAEYCGTEHSLMRGEVVVMDPEDYDRWILSQRQERQERADAPPTGQEPERQATSLVERGRNLATTLGCLRCHSIDGEKHIGPSWLDLYRREEKLTDGQQVVVDEAYLTESMMDPRARVVAGFDPVMPSFRGRIEGADTAALVEFIKSLRSR
jgi:cytochrome c oxidase subunit 2